MGPSLSTGLWWPGEALSKFSGSGEDSPTESRALGLSRVSRSTVGEIRWLRTLGAARVPSLRAASLRIARRSDPNPERVPSPLGSPLLRALSQALSGSPLFRPPAPTLWGPPSSERVPSPLGSPLLRALSQALSGSPLFRPPAPTLWGPLSSDPLPQPSGVPLPQSASRALWGPPSSERCPKPSRGPLSSDPLPQPSGVPLLRARPEPSGVPPPQSAVPSPLGVPSLQTPCPNPLGSPPLRALSRALWGPPSSERVPSPLAFPAQTRYLSSSRGLLSPVPTNPLPNSRRSSPPGPHSAQGPLASAHSVTVPRPSALTSDLLSPPPGPASPPPPPLPLPHLFPSRSSAAGPPEDARVGSLSAGSGHAEPPPAVSGSGPTLSGRTPPPSPPGATRTLPQPPLLLSEVRLLPGVANRTRLRRARSAPRSQFARPLPPTTPPARLQ
ncbi:proline-rich protein 36-like [Canis lupus familiaris]|uniref:proline-rich protein 36-like n=1 Tax=Canis lupus familiaris TaxID=9615 RepID=UPI0018F2873D|nr:proline-rich protein 36-like [Canis lupus familiaris]